jgi:cytochrome c-type biogenesis protein CcmH/NrfG
MNEDVNQEILKELRRLRRSQEWSVYVVLLALAVLAAYLAFVRPHLFPSRSANQAQSVWTKVTAALDRGDNENALSIAKDFVARQPRYDYAHALLGSVYVAVGDFTNAEAAYARAVQLYPDEANEKALTVVRKRLAGDQANPTPAK